MTLETCSATFGPHTLTFSVRSGEQGRWDRGIIREVIDQDCYRLQRLVDQNFNPKTILDVGAHIGSFSVLARKLWSEARIEAYEPWGPNYDLLVKNIEGLEIKACRSALIEGNEEWVGFREPGVNTGSGEADRAGGALVRARGICGIVSQASKPILLKLDCEGSEADLLQSIRANGLLAGMMVVGEWHGDKIKSRLGAIMPGVGFYGREKELGYFEAEVL